MLSDMTSVHDIEEIERRASVHIVHSHADKIEDFFVVRWMETDCGILAESGKDRNKQGPKSDTNFGIRL